MRKILFLASIATMLIGCFSADRNERFLPDSLGQPYEVFVVTPTDIFRGPAGDSLKKSFEDDIHMISFSEKKFKLLNITPEGFKGISRHHRNIIFLNVGKEYTTGSIKTGKNLYAEPQMVVTIDAMNVPELTRLITSGRDTIVQIMAAEELDRFAKKATLITDTKLKAEIAKKFKISINIPEGYKIRNNSIPNFMWISYELPESSQGVLIYEYPYNGEAITNYRIVDERNKFAAKVPGELPNSHMTTADIFAPETDVKSINGKEWYETRGFWRVKNDFQGGPFVSYTSIDEKRKRVIVLDWYVYSPNPDKGQGTYLRQLEGIMETTIIME